MQHRGYSAQDRQSKQILAALAKHPLATQHELTAILGMPATSVKLRLWVLRNVGLVRVVDTLPPRGSASGRRRQVYVLAEPASAAA